MDTHEYCGCDFEGSRTVPKREIRTYGGVKFLVTGEMRKAGKGWYKFFERAFPEYGYFPFCDVMILEPICVTREGK